MNIDKRWVLLLAAAASATAGALVASKLRRLDRREARVLEQKTQLKSWENEGGNLAPSPAVAVLP